MSAMPAPPCGLSGDPGYVMLLRGQTFNGYSPAKYGPLWNYRLLPGRAGDAGAVLFVLIYDRTWSAFGCPEWARITLPEFCEYAPHKTARAIRFTLEFLVEIHLIERDPKDPWRFKTHPENVAIAPLLMPIRHPNAAAKKRQARAASMAAPALTAAFRNMPEVYGQTLPQPVESGRTEPTGGPGPTPGPAGQPLGLGSPPLILPESGSPPELKQVSPCDEHRVIEEGSSTVKPTLDATAVSCEPVGGTKFTNELVATGRPEASLTHVVEQNASQNGSEAEMKQVSTDSQVEEVKPVSIDLKQVADIWQPVSAEGEMHVPQDETHCPLGWACPFLDSDLGGSKPLIQIKQSLQAGQPAVVAEESADRPATPNEVAQIRKLLLDELSDRLPGDRPSDVLCQRIHQVSAPVQKSP
jgi:hypothetical protein